MAENGNHGFPRKRFGLERAQMERAEGWDEAIGLAPELSFPRSWSVKIIPPFGGALMRFIVRKGRTTVSVYADFNEALGYYGEPHWEIYPNADDDNERFALADTEGMMSAISKSLAKWNRLKGTPT